MYLNIFDSHTHSDTSWDAEHSLTFLCETAVKKGILGFAITDHCEINEYVTRDIETRIRQGYFEMLKARAAFGKSLMLSYGIELGQMNSDLDLTHHVLEMKPYDFVLGSLHCIRGNEDFYFMDFKDEDPYALLEEYYQELYEVAKLNLFDSMAHITYPIRYMNGTHHLGVDLSRMDDLIDLTLRTLVQNGKALEINTSGLRGPIGETSPTLKYVKRFRELGGEYVTLGSDAHSAKIWVTASSRPWKWPIRLVFLTLPFTKNGSPGCCKFIRRNFYGSTALFTAKQRTPYQQAAGCHAGTGRRGSGKGD